MLDYSLEEGDSLVVQSGSGALTTLGFNNMLEIILRGKRVSRIFVYYST